MLLITLYWVYGISESLVSMKVLSEILKILLKFEDLLRPRIEIDLIMDQQT